MRALSAALCSGCVRNYPNDYGGSRSVAQRSRHARSTRAAYAVGDVGLEESRTIDQDSPLDRTDFVVEPTKEAEAEQAVDADSLRQIMNVHCEIVEAEPE